MLTRVGRAALKNMSNTKALSELFQTALHLKHSDDAVTSKINYDVYTPTQQAKINELIDLSDKFPDSLAQLNDELRTTTYLLNTQGPTEVDSILLARVSPYAAKFSDESVVENRHIVRWIDLLQNVLTINSKIPVNHDLTASREVKKKEPKKGTHEPVGAVSKDKNAKGTKQTTPAAAAGVAGAAGVTGAVAAGASADGATEKVDKKKAAKEKAKEKTKKETPQARPVTPGLIDLRVGFIEKAVKHPDADSLYVSTINVGEEEPRTICSGLVNFVPIEDMQRRYVVIVANLKPVKMRGIVSNGMVLCASTKDHSKVEFVNPPKDSKPGDKLFFQTYDEEPEKQLNPKKKVWEQIQPGFTTNDEYEVVYEKESEPARKLVNKEGEPLKASTIKHAFLIRRSLEKDQSGSLTLLPEDSEDMWFIFNLVQEGDEVETKTMRKIVPIGKDGTPTGPGVRKLLKLRVRIAKIDFDPEGNLLRLNGPTVLDVPDVSAGTFHTIQLELNRSFEIFKDEWDAFALQIVTDATNVENKSDIAAVVLQPGLAHICLVTDAMTVLKTKVEKNIPRKRRGDNAGQDTAMRKFFHNIYDALCRNINIEKIKVVLLAAPGQVARDLYDYIFQYATAENNTLMVKSKSKFLVVHASSGHLHALDEAMAKPEVQNQLQDTRYGRESAVMNKFFKALNDDNMQAWYGPKHVEAVIEAGAIQALMITDSLFRSSNIAERRRYVQMTEAVREMGREVFILSSFHSSGEQLDNVTGVACISVYPLPDLEDIDESASETE